ncbi:50S ribosomal protein L18e [compost metagenome]
MGDGELKKKLKISAHRFSKSALEKIEKAGGQSIVIPGPAPVVKNTKKKKK